MHFRHADCRQTFVTEELFDKERVAQFVSVTGDANILHADPDDEGSPVQGETSELQGQAAAILL